MPGFDRTGPQGVGPATGGGWGYCGAARGGRSFRPGAGYRRGQRGGRGLGGRFGSGFAPNLPAVDSGDVDVLRAEARQMETALQALNRRIAAAEGRSGD